VEEGMTEILKSGKRAAALTHQLLAYSRQQIMAFQILNLNSSVMNMGGLLKRLIQEDIETSYNLEPNLPCISADPSQMEQVILNLVINARDALPKGGKIGISTAKLDLDRPDPLRYPNVEAGSYVRLAISDDGMGMDENTKARIFEPFFTTKEQGKGTGMGLSTVYGIVKQSSGHILVESKMYCGSTFTVLFPAADSNATEADTSSYPRPDRILGQQTILVVDDEKSVRRYLLLLLESQGYKVLAAGDCAEAMKIGTDFGGDIHLLLTDLVMPDCNGRELADRLVSRRPKMKVLLVSGHSDDAILNHGGFDGGHFFLSKPFTTSVLLEKIHDILPRSAGGVEIPYFLAGEKAWPKPARAHIPPRA
jgi:two-component system, cell cycle sensor histidine kinase and response regulator CckA